MRHRPYHPPSRYPPSNAWDAPDFREHNACQTPSVCRARHYLPARELSPAVELHRGRLARAFLRDELLLPVRTDHPGSDQLGEPAYVGVVRGDGLIVVAT